MIRKEKDIEIRKKAAAILMKTNDKDIINRLFLYAERTLFKRDFLLKLVELSGYVKSRESFPHLKKLFLHKPLFYTKKRDDLRIAVATSLGRLRTEEAMELVRQGMEDERENVKKMCDIIFKLTRQKADEQFNNGAGDGPAEKKQ